MSGTSGSGCAPCLCRLHTVYRAVHPLSHFRSRTHAASVVFATALLQVVEDGYEFFAKRQLVTIFSAPNYCGEFDNAGAMMSVDETLMCSFQVSHPCLSVFL